MQWKFRDLYLQFTFDSMTLLYKCFIVPSIVFQLFRNNDKVIIQASPCEKVSSEICGERRPRSEAAHAHSLIKAFTIR